ncbi:MAG: hypothetical protein LBH81_03805 [Rickettsiales bacterium]|jgi:hypothetical protein|nr:hypothetical protein [Rickettsiales bacterium]
MKNLLNLLAVLLIIALAGAAVFLSAEIYTAAKKSEVVPVVFQTSNYAEGRADIVPFDEIPDDEAVDWLVRRWIVEAYYVIPDMADVRTRGAEGRDSFIWFMSDSQSAVFETWRQSVFPDIEELAAKRGLREVRVQKIAKEGDYYRVDFRLDSWTAPDKRRTETRTAYVRVEFERGLRPNAERILKNGGDASKIFKFRVNDFRI